MQVGSLIAYLSYLIQILIAVVMVTFMVSMIPRAAVAAERIVEVLDTESSVRPPEHPVTELAEHGTLEFRDVGFRYPGAEHAGAERHVVPGRGRHRPRRSSAAPASGKSTLVNLVPRLFDATDGAVLVDGVDVRDLDPELLWSKVGLRPAEGRTSSPAPWPRNLRFGRPDATDDELWEALEIAQAAGFVRAMPDGLDSAITQGGTERVGRPAAAAVDRPGARARSPRSTCSTTRSRPSTSPPTPGCGPRWHPHTDDAAVVSWPSGCRRSPTPTRSW